MAVASKRRRKELEFQFIKKSVFPASFYYPDRIVILLLPITVYQFGWEGCMAYLSRCRCISLHDAALL